MINRATCKIILVCLSAYLSIVVNHNATGQEIISSYHSDIAIRVDGSMNVTETISVISTGDQIRRGIYRDFPTRYEDRFGNSVRIDFNIVGVTRNGITIPWSTQERSNGVRVYAGNIDENAPILNPGNYDFSIEYTTDRQLGFFESNDELYWNVTGNGWLFPIEKASASITLPQILDSSSLTIEAYTGLVGETGASYRSSISNGAAFVETTAALPQYGGLSFAMTWPKGIVTEPSTADRIGHLFTDNIGLLISLLTLLIVSYYLYRQWDRVGRDPKPGVIFPHYEPPTGYSPASTRYILSMRYDSKVFTAAIINLAVKGHLGITKTDKKYSLTHKESESELAAGEQALMVKLFAADKTIILENTNHVVIGQAKSAHKKALRKDYLNRYFSRNSQLLIPSLLASFLMMTVAVFIGGMSPVVIALFVLNALVHLLFLYLLQAPSAKGRLLMDKLEGFKLYLEVAEQDDLNLRNPPNKTPKLFESYLPYAIALGVEQAWSEQFSTVFAALQKQEGTHYHPVWYHGHFNTLHLAAFTTDISSGFNTAISSAAQAPGTSSGSGGSGMSGGGGGGGGGGGF